MTFQIRFVDSQAVLSRCCLLMVRHMVHFHLVWVIQMNLPRNIVVEVIAKPSTTNDPAFVKALSNAIF